MTTTERLLDLVGELEEQVAGEMMQFKAGTQYAGQPVRVVSQDPASGLLLVKLGGASLEKVDPSDLEPIQ